VKLLEENLSDEVLAALSASVVDGALAIGQLDKRANFVASNGSLQKLAGRPVVGTPVHQLFAPAQRQVLDEALAAPEGGVQRRILGMFPDDRGVPGDFMVTFRRLSVGWLLVAEPAVTAVRAVNDRLIALNEELAQAQRQIRQQNATLHRQNDQLRELDELKDTLLANVSHDMRTPLAAILGYAELLNRRGGLTAQQAQATEVVERNARRLLRLLDDLLLLGQISAGELRLNLEPVDLSQLATDAVELVRPLAEQAQLRIELQLQPGDAGVDGDRFRIAQLLDNLISNAIKFTPAGGTVTIRTRDGPDGTSVAITDTGPGIPERDQHRIYEPFTRGSEALAPGTGLGLAIVRAIADAHQATIDLETRPRDGTQFTITFPTQHRRVEVLRAGDRALSTAKEALDGRDHSDFGVSQHAAGPGSK
jgi:signal transduction histidine kinase